VVCELSTFPIADKEKARKALTKGGITLLDCPLSGTGSQAETGDLVVYASGDPKPASSVRRRCFRDFPGRISISVPSAMAAR